MKAISKALLMTVICTVHISYSQNCFIKITLGGGFDADTTSLTINNVLIMDRQIIQSSNRSKTDVHILLTKTSDSTCFVSLLGHKIPSMPLKSLKFPWKNTEMHLKILINRKEFKEQVILPKGNYISIDYLQRITFPAEDKIKIYQQFEEFGW